MSQVDSSMFGALNDDPGLATPSAANETAAAHASKPGAQAAEGYGGGSALRNILRATIRPTLSDAGEKHKETVKQIITAEDTAIKPYDLPAPYVGTLYTMGNKGYVITYDDGILGQRDDNTPPSNILHNVREHARAIYNDMTGKDNLDILSDPIIYPNDYHLSRQLANNIVLSLRYSQPDSPFRTSFLELGREHFRVNYQPSVINRFLDHYYPHGVRPRSDCMFAIEIYNRNEFKQDEWITLMVLPMYPEIRRTYQYAPMGYGMGGQHQKKFNPVLHIPMDFPTIFPCFEALSFILPIIIAEYGGYDSKWAAPFRHFDGSQPNLGRLIPKQKEGDIEYYISTPEELQQFINYEFTAPIYVLDYTHGRCNLPSSRLFTKNTPNVNEIIGKRFAEFIGDPALAGIQYNNNSFEEIIGTILIENQLRDTREIDEFYMANFVQGAELDKFRHRGNREWDRLNDIREAFRNVQQESPIDARYSNVICPLTGTGLNQLAISTSNKLTFVTYDRNAYGMLGDAEYASIVSSYNEPIRPQFRMESFYRGGYPGGGGFNGGYRP